MSTFVVCFKNKSVTYNNNPGLIIYFVRVMWCVHVEFSDLQVVD